MSSERLKKYALTGSVTCAGQKQPLAPNSAVKPCVQQEQKNKNYEKKKEKKIQFNARKVKCTLYGIYNIIE